VAGAAGGEPGGTPLPFLAAFWFEPNGPSGHPLLVVVNFGTSILPLCPRIAIVGAGAIGTYYGARLALAGADVHFFVRSGLAEMRARGIILREGAVAQTLPPERIAAYASTGEIGPVDVAIVTLKNTANGRLADLLPPLLGPRTIILTLQNGLGADELLASLFGAERIVGGLAFIAAVREALGEIRIYTPGYVTLGEFKGPASARVRWLVALFQRAEVKCEAVDNLDEARWRKLVWNVPYNGLTIAAGGVPTDRILASPKWEGEVRALIDEVVGAAARFGYTIPEDFIAEQFAHTRRMGAYQPSSLIDYLAGREVEVEAIWGEPLRRAQAAGAAMPHLEQLYARLKQLTAGRK
jgi:2-dehydropantoate 2-reductase